MVAADFAHSPEALENRRSKAITLARAAYEQGLSVDAVRALTELEQRARERAHGLRTSHRDELWAAVAGLLTQRYEWDENERARVSARTQPPARPPGRRGRGNYVCKFWSGAAQAYCGATGDDVGLYTCGERCTPHSPAVLTAARAASALASPRQ